MSSKITHRTLAGEVDDLLNSAPEARGVSGRTRGAKVDAFKQEKELDQALQDAGVANDE